MTGTHPKCLLIRWHLSKLCACNSVAVWSNGEKKYAEGLPIRHCFETIQYPLLFCRMCVFLSYLFTFGKEALLMVLMDPIWKYLIRASLGSFSGFTCLSFLTIFLWHFKRFLLIIGGWAAPFGSLNLFCERKHLPGRQDRSLVLVGSLLRCLPLTPCSIYELSFSCSAFPSLLEKCVLFSIISFQHLQSSSQSVNCLQLPLCVFSHPPPLCFYQSLLVFPSSVLLLPHLLLPSSTSRHLSFMSGVPLPSVLWLCPGANWLAIVWQCRSSSPRLVTVWHSINASHYVGLQTTQCPWLSSGLGAGCSPVVPFKLNTTVLITFVSSSLSPPALQIPAIISLGSSNGLA